VNLLAEVPFDAPHISYGRLSPLLIVFGVAVVGVLVEAFAVGLPVVTFLPIAGHGKDNAEGMEALGVTRYARTTEELRAALDVLAVPGPERQAQIARAHALFVGDAADDVLLEAARRASNFDEVVAGLDERSAVFEARRCLSCGNCFSCDNCYGVCPDNAVIKLGEPGELYEIDLDFCKGCGLCVAECPCGAIEMVPEQI